jgi:hypothetical protein
MARKVTTKRLSSGKYVDLQNLTVEDVDIKDISQSLNYIYRFTGHYKSKPPLTVAQHTRLAVYLSTIVFPNDLTVKFDVLLHDFPEYITGDIATPLKYIFGPQFKDYEHGIEKIVYEALWKIDTPFTHEIYEQRKICDLLALDIERRNIWADPSGKEQWPEIPMESLFSVKEKKEVFDKIQNDRFVDIEKMYKDILKEING